MYAKDGLKLELEKKYPDFFSSPYFDHIDAFYDDGGFPHHERIAAITFKYETESKIEFGRLLFQYKADEKTNSVYFLLERKLTFMVHERLFPDTFNLLYEGTSIHGFEEIPLWFQNIAHDFFKKVRLRTIFDK